MSNPFSRTEILFGKDAMERLATARVAVFGVGGGGSGPFRHRRHGSHRQRHHM